jgi:RNase P subunit RPR2
MATIRKLRGRWQAQVRRRGMAPRAKSFDAKSDAERWARSLEAQVDRCGALPDTRLAEQMTLKQILTRYREEVSPTKRSSQSEQLRIDAIIRRPICHRTLALLTTGVDLRWPIIPSTVRTRRAARYQRAGPEEPLLRQLLLGPARHATTRRWQRLALEIKALNHRIGSGLG